MENSSADTQKHIDRVAQFISEIVFSLQVRAVSHDFSKLISPEREYFDKFTSSLSKLTYGSEEYKKSLEELKPALDNHYSHNRHHPQYFENGVDDMTLVDLIEMLCDWKASSERHADGDIHKSLKINEERFKISPQLLRILENTVKEYLEGKA